jgi:MerT mercuric transport protein
MQERNRIIASGGSAVGLSMFASFVGLCCIGPWTVALLGASGAVSMARWQPFRPYILGVAASLLAWAFWRTYRLKRVCLAEGCANKQPGAAMYFSLYLSALLLLLAVFAERLQWLLIDPTPAALR